MTRRIWARVAVPLGMMLAPLSLMALGACMGSTLASEAPAAGVSVTGDQVVLGGARGFAAAELVYITAADAATRAADAGLIRGAAATRLRALNGQARGVLVAGRGAIDAAGKARAAAELFDLVDRIDTISGGQ